MQKKVLAAMIGGMLIAPAAFAEVNISGRLAVGLELYELDGGARTPYNSEMRLSDQSSSIIFSGSEDLGGGLKAWFQIDNRFNIPGGVNAFDSSGNTQVGLQGGFGKLGIGRADLHYHESNALETTRSGSLQSWLAPGIMSQVNGESIASGTRSLNVAVWDGAFGGGLTARLAYSTAPFANEGSGAAGDGSDGDAINAALRWSAGPLSLGASLWSAQAEGTGGAEQDGLKLWGGYKLGAFSVGLVVDQSSTTTAAPGNVESERTAFMVPVRFTTGAETFTASFATADDLEVGGTDQANSGASAFKLSWDHALSKRTFVGVHYVSLENDANAAYQLFARGLSGTAAVAGEDVTQIYFGLAHFY